MPRSDDRSGRNRQRDRGGRRPADRGKQRQASRAGSSARAGGQAGSSRKEPASKRSAGQRGSARKDPSRASLARRSPADGKAASRNSASASSTRRSPNDIRSSTRRPQAGSSTRRSPAAGSNRGPANRPARRDGDDRDQEDWGQERRQPANNQPNPLVFIIPGGGLLLLIIMVAMGSSSGAPRKNKAKDRSYTPQHTANYRSKKEVTEGERVYDRAMGMMANAQAMPLGPDRNAAFRETRKVFERARDMLQRSGLKQKSVLANQHCYSCMKYATD